MTTKMFKVSELMDNGIDTGDIGKYNKTSKDGWRLLEVGVDGQSRWMTHYHVIFQTPDQVTDNKFAWECYYSNGSTECQDADVDDNPFLDDDGEIEARLMEAVPSIEWKLHKS